VISPRVEPTIFENLKLNVFKLSSKAQIIESYTNGLNKFKVAMIKMRWKEMMLNKGEVLVNQRMLESPLAWTHKQKQTLKIHE
jgi:hypothetical protein